MIQALRESGVMRVKDLNGRFSIGTLVYGPKLWNAMDEGGLDTLKERLVFNYREIYGRPFWNEYLVCSDKNCGKKIGLGKKENLKERDNYFLAHGNEFCCPDCQSPMIFFHGPEKTKRAIAAAFRDKIFASLAFDCSMDNEKLIGFALGVETTIRDGYEDKINTGPDDAHVPPLTYKEYLEELRSSLGSHYGEDHPAFQVAEWGTLSDYRRFGTSVPMLNELCTAANSKISGQSIHPIPLVARTILPIKNLAENVGCIAGKPYGEGEIRLYSTLPRLIERTNKL